MKIIPTQPADSVSIYKNVFIFFHIVGINTACNKYICGFYDLLVNLSVTLFYPLHLTIGLFLIPTQAEVFKNLAATITCIVCSIKHYILRYKLPKIHAMLQLLSELDKRIISADERKYFNSQTLPAARRIVNMFLYVYAIVHLAASSGALLSKEHRLMYPAWLPFDWQANALYFYLALTYQILGATLVIAQNLANDMYPPLSLCILSGHVHLLRMRVAKVGTDLQKSAEQHNRELVECIEDHKKLMHTFWLLQDTLSFEQFTQFFSTGLNICVVLMYLLFYVDTVPGYIYYTTYFIGMAVELFPCCYYGTIVQQEFQQLPSAIFKCNWLQQSRKFHQNQRIFTELSLRDVTPTAGGVFGIGLNAFFGTCKMAYSLFTVVMRMK